QTLTFNVTERSTNPKDKDKQQHAGYMTLDGVLGENFAPIDLLVAHFLKDGYRPAPKQLKTLRGGGRGTLAGYTQTFSIPKVELDKRDPRKYTRRIEEKP